MEKEVEKIKICRKNLRQLTKWSKIGRKLTKWRKIEKFVDNVGKIGENYE